MRTISIVLAGLFCSVADAQIVRIQTVFNKCENGQCREFTSQATGIVIHRDNGFSYVATAGHTFGNKGEIVSVHNTPAVLLAWKYADGDDFAVLRCRQLSKSTLFGLAGSDPAKGSAVALHGLGRGDKFGRGDYSIKKASVTGSGVASVPSRQGDSGGPLIDSAGKICGLISTTTANTTGFVPVSRLRAWLGRCACMPGWRGAAPEPPAEDIVEDIPDTEKTDRIRDLERQLAEMRKQLDAIQNKPDRPKSKPVDLSGIEKRLADFEGVSIPIRIETTAGKIIRQKVLSLERIDGRWSFKPIVLRFDESVLKVSN